MSVELSTKRSGGPEAIGKILNRVLATLEKWDKRQLRGRSCLKPSTFNPLARQSLAEKIENVQHD